MSRIYTFYGTCTAHDGDTPFFTLFASNASKILGEEEFNFEGRRYRLVFIRLFHNYITATWQNRFIHTR